MNKTWDEPDTDTPMVSSCCLSPLAGLVAFTVGAAIYVATRGVVGAPLAALAACGAGGAVLVGVNEGQVDWWTALDAAVAAAIATATIRAGGFDHTALWWRHNFNRWFTSTATAASVWVAVFATAVAAVYGLSRAATWRRPSRRDEEGAAGALECVLLVPVLLAVITLAVAR